MHGDYKYLGDNRKCEDLEKKDPRACYNKDDEGLCCESCASIRKKNKEGWYQAIQKAHYYLRNVILKPN